MTTHYAFEANDGEKLVYQSHGKKGEVVLILLHGFTGSSEYFTRNYETLSREAWVIAPDLRGHGLSTKAQHGYHVSRLAMDLKNLMDHLTSTVEGPCRFIGVGCSLGAAVLWSFTELFGSRDFAGMIFVDQAPLQDYLPDGTWSSEHGNYGCHDATSLAWAQATLRMRPDDFYRGLVQSCLAYRFQPGQHASISAAEREADEEFFVNISRQGNPQWFAKLLANHTSYDHRDTLANVIGCPCYVMAASGSGSFPVAGMQEITNLINFQKPGLCATLVVDSSHWMFYETAERWSALVLDICKTFHNRDRPGNKQAEEKQARDVRRWSTASRRRMLILRDVPRLTRVAAGSAMVWAGGLQVSSISPEAGTPPATYLQYSSGTTAVFFSLLLATIVSLLPFVHFMGANLLLDELAEALEGLSTDKYAAITRALSCIGVHISTFEPTTKSPEHTLSLTVHEVSNTDGTHVENEHAAEFDAVKKQWRLLRSGSEAFTRGKYVTHEKNNDILHERMNHESSNSRESSLQQVIYEPMEHVQYSADQDWTEMLPHTAHVEFLKSRDWAATELGPMKDWSSSLRLMTRKMLADPRPANLYWGKGRVSLYNEAFAVMAYSRHPKMMGSTGEVALPATWSFLGPMMDEVERSGIAFSLPAFEMAVEKTQGLIEEAWYDGIFLPIRHDDGSVPGFTIQLIERGTRLLHHIAGITNSKDATVWQHIANACEPFDRDIPFLALYSATAEDTPQSLRCSLELEAVLGLNKGHPAIPNHLELQDDDHGFAQALRAAKTRNGPVVLGASNEGEIPEEINHSIKWRGHGTPATHVVVTPLFVTGLIAGFLIAGLNPRRPFDDDHSQFAVDLGRAITGILSSTFNHEQALAREKKLSEELTKREKFMRSLAEIVTVGIFRLSVDESLTYTNSKYYHITGVSKDSAEAPNINLLSYIVEEDQHKVLDAFHVCRSQKVAATCDVRLRKMWKPSGSDIEENCWALVSTIPHIEPGNVYGGLVGCLTDISHLKWAEKLQKTSAEAATLARTQQERFIDLTSHEMRNPMSAIIQSADDICSSLERARKSSNEHDELVDAVESILDSAQTILLCTAHQKRIVDDILTVSKLDSSMMTITPVLANVSDMVRQTTQMFHAEMSALDIEFEETFDQSIDYLNAQWAYCDPSRVTQILVNLLTNAIKFTKTAERRAIQVRHGASLDIPTAYVDGIHWYPSGQKRKSVVKLEGLGSGQSVYLIFMVKDTGKGITANEMSVLFDRFTQANTKTHIQYGGSGLGLFISRELTELQGGRIGSASTPGQGSTFVFYVKAVKPAQGEIERAQLEASPSSRRNSPAGVTSLQCSGRRSGFSSKIHTPERRDSTSSATQQAAPFEVLLVEDNIVNQKVLSKQLRRLGCIVYIANHGVEALDFLETTRYWRDNDREGPSLNIILMDWEMPILDGLSCTRRIREMEEDGRLTEHLLIVATTANARAEQVKMAMDAGVDDLLAKPFKVDEVMKRITKAV